MATPNSRNQNQYDGLPDIHMNTAKGLTVGVPDIRMATAKGMTMDKDIYMDTAKANTTIKQGNFKVWEKELLDSPEVRRKATVAQLCAYRAFRAVWSYRPSLNLPRLSRLLLPAARIHCSPQGATSALR